MVLGGSTGFEVVLASSGLLLVVLVVTAAPQGKIQVQQGYYMLNIYSTS